MTTFKKFALDQSGSTLSAISTMAGAITICCLSAAFLLDKVSSPPGRLPNMPTPRTESAANFTMNQVTVDYTPTASIPNTVTRPIILDPCTGARK